MRLSTPKPHLGLVLGLAAVLATPSARAEDSPDLTFALESGYALRWMSDAYLEVQGLPRGAAPTATASPLFTTTGRALGITHVGTYGAGFAFGLALARWSVTVSVRIGWLLNAPDSRPTDPNVAQQVTGYSGTETAMALRGMFYIPMGSTVRLGLGGSLGAAFSTVTLTDASTPRIDPRAYDYRPVGAAVTEPLIEPRVSLEFRLNPRLRLGAWTTATFLPVASLGGGISLSTATTQ